MLLDTGLKAFLQHLIGGFSVHVILVLAIHRGVVNQAIALIFRHRPIREQGAITIARSTTEGLPFASRNEINASPVPSSWIAFSVSNVGLGRMVAPLPSLLSDL